MRELSAMEMKEEVRIGKRLAENTHFSLKEVCFAVFVCLEEVCNLFPIKKVFVFVCFLLF